jgi:hypothetical protein
MRTDLSEEAVARMGRVGWGALSQARVAEGGVKRARGESWRVGDGGAGVVMVAVVMVAVVVGGVVVLGVVIGI